VPRVRRWSSPRPRRPEAADTRSTSAGGVAWQSGSGGTVARIPCRVPVASCWTRTGCPAPVWTPASPESARRARRQRQRCGSRPHRRRPTHGPAPPGRSPPSQSPPRDRGQAGPVRRTPRESPLQSTVTDGSGTPVVHLRLASLVGSRRSHAVGGVSSIHQDAAGACLRRRRPSPRGTAPHSTHVRRQAAVETKQRCASSLSIADHRCRNATKAVDDTAPPKEGGAQAASHPVGHHRHRARDEVPPTVQQARQRGCPCWHRPSVPVRYSPRRSRHR
jgi:hypothetical protein